MSEIKQLGGTKIKSRIKAVSIPRIQGLGTQSLSTEVLVDSGWSQADALFPSLAQDW